MQSLILPALFWQFSLTSQRGRFALNFSLPWVKRVQRSHAQRKLVALAWRKLIQEGAKKLLAFRQ